MSYSSSDTPLHEHSAAPAPEPLTLDGEDFPFDDPVKEERYQQARAELLLTDDPRAKPNWLMLLLISVAVFIIFETGNLSGIEIAILIGVLLFHEMGHMLAMRWFGYTDVRMFFIPLFGALVMGKKHAAPAWQQAWVALLGPLPGLILACVGYLVVRDQLPPGGWHLIIILVGLNAFNLLPLGFLDGGRFFSIILFSRNAWVEATMQVISAGLLGALALWQHSIYLGVLAFFMLMGTTLVFRKGLMVTKLRGTGIQLPLTIKELQPLHLRMLFAATYDVLNGVKVDAKTLANHMRELHNRVLVPPPGWLATIGFLLVYLLAWVLAFIAVALPMHDRQRLHEEFIAAHKRVVLPKQLALADAQREVRNQKGDAKRKAQEKVKRLQKEYQEALQAVQPLKERLKNFDFLGRQQDIREDLNFADPNEPQE